MSGHSKWNTIKRKKEKTDTQRAKIFTKIGRELTVAVKEGGCDPNSNSKLRDCISKAKVNNVPNDNIERIIKKASDSNENNNFHEIMYEGYGPGSVAIIVIALTNKKNRTAANIRHHFDKYGGNLGTSGCVSYMFNQKGVIVIEAEGINRNKFEEIIIESGALDFEYENQKYVIYTKKEDYENIYNYFKQKNFEIVSSHIEMMPNNYIKPSDDNEIEKIHKLLNSLEEDEDVKDIWSNLEVNT